MQGYHLGCKIISEDAAQVLEIIGRPDAAALIVGVTSRETSVGAQ